MHYAFHINVFARPPSSSKAALPIDLRGIRVAPLQTVEKSPLVFDISFPVTFEQAFAALTSLPRLDAELDGFFVLAGGPGPTLWRVSGHLFDYGGRLHRVELHGDCPAEAFDAILACLGWPQTPPAFELVREGIALEEADFRAWAAASPVDA